ncbi:MAG: LptF/LptG family permease, partial [Sulfurovum sp.]|nr:LptF/LptG family permease [Sulfurovum sp.]NNJ45954.1 LptF/LptG family permease [Sulfurovum sp.]
NGELKRYSVEHKERIETLKGYKPKIIESLYEGKALNIRDAYSTWKLLHKQNLSSDKIRASLYDKVVVPLFSMALLLILFFKLPFHARMMNIGAVIALSLAVTFIIWGILFGLSQMGANGVLVPELTAILPVILLWGYAIYIYFTDERSLV